MQACGSQCRRGRGFGHNLARRRVQGLGRREGCAQLLEALLEHPAFAPPAKPKSAAEQVQDQLGGVQKQAEQALGNAMKGLKGLKKPSWMK